MKLARYLIGGAMHFRQHEGMAKDSACAGTVAAYRHRVGGDQRGLMTGPDCKFSWLEFLGGNLLVVRLDGRDFMQQPIWAARVHDFLLRRQ